MNKLFFSILLGASMLTSCSMDELPYGQIDDETAIQNRQDALRFRNGIYNTIRTITNGGYIYYTEIQSDMFIGTQINGNRLGNISLGNINSNDTDLEGIWAAPYAGIADVNYFLPFVEKLIEAPLSDKDHAELVRYRGEAKWTRAYLYWYLADHYCPAYTRCNPQDEITGVPLVIEYNPTDDYASYPGRSSLAEVYAQIEKDLNDAYSDILAYEKSGIKGATDNLAPNAPYLSSAVVLALQARIALNKGEYEKAIAKAKEVINLGKFPLTTLRDYSKIWTSDKGSELIFVPYADLSQSSGLSSMGSAYIGSTTDQADYVAAANALALYEGDDDIRYGEFFEPRRLSVNGAKVVSPCFIKYPGNPAFNTGSSNALKNLAKPFRTSELYLIIAESAANLGLNDEANNALNSLRSVRLYGYYSETYNGAALLKEVKLERTRELVGEGFRMSDLRRWDEGFSRSDAYTEPDYDETSTILVKPGVSVRYAVGDHRFLLPIPTAEMETNPQLKGQQNPGY